MTPGEMVAREATQAELRGVIAQAARKGELRCVALSDDGSIRRVKFQKDPRPAMLREIPELPGDEPAAEPDEREEVRVAENCTTCGRQVGPSCDGFKRTCDRGSHWIIRE